MVWNSLGLMALVCTMVPYFHVGNFAYHRPLHLSGSAHLIFFLVCIKEKNPTFIPDAAILWFPHMII